MANRKRETAEQKAARQRQERIDLLKMKQGIIEESDVIPQEEHTEVPAPRGGKRLSNFIYRNKPFIVVALILIFVAGLGIYQYITRERVDLYVLAVARTEDCQIGLKADDLKTALEKYCPDYDGNGVQNVEVDFVQLDFDDPENQIQVTEIEKFRSHLKISRAQLVITESEMLDYLKVNNYPENFFVENPAEVSEDLLVDNVGIPLNRTDLARSSGWQDCPDNVMLFVRDEAYNDKSNAKANVERRERAVEVLKNIVAGNVVKAVSDE